MKKLLITLLCLPMIGFGQTKIEGDFKYNEDLKEIQSNVKNIEYRLKQHHKQFTTGSTISFIGFGMTLLGYMIPSQNLSIVGGMVGMGGSLVMWNSHKWFNGDRYNELNLNYRKYNKEEKKLKKLLNEGLISETQYLKSVEKLKELL